MQLIFITLFLLFILLPGISARLGYLKRDGLITVAGSKFYIEVIFIVFISLCIHLTLWVIFDQFTSKTFDVNLFYKIVIGQYVDLDNNKTPIFLFVLYNVSISAFLFILGLVTNVNLSKRFWRFNENFSFLEYTGNWDRILSTDISKENRKALYSKKASLDLKVAVLTVIGEKSILYKGKLLRYYIDSKGFIDKLVLLKAYRAEVLDNNNSGANSQSNANSSNKNDNSSNINADKSKKQDDNGNTKEIFKQVFSSQKTKKNKTIGSDHTKINNHHFVIFGSTIRNISIDYDLIPVNKNNGRNLIAIIIQKLKSIGSWFR